MQRKWRDKVNSEKLLDGLKEKARFANWNDRKEHYCIIAKSFKKRPKPENCLLFDLNDIERAF